jgi:tyrosyl-tRNA synthetase
MRLAREIVETYHGPQAAGAAEEAFRRVFQEGENPDKMAVFRLRRGLTLADLLVEAALAGSKGEARRLVGQRGVKLDGVTLEDPNQALSLEAPAVLQVGKRRFIRLEPC